MNKSKFIKYLTVGFLSISALAAITVSMVSFTNEENEVEVVAEETNIPNFDRFVYLDATNWGDSDVEFAVYCFNDSANTWVDMLVKSKDEHIYYAEIPEGYNKIIFGRMNPDRIQNGFAQDTELYNQSGDLDFVERGLYTRIQNDNDWNGWTATGSTYDNAYVAPSSETITIDVNVGENITGDVYAYVFSTKQNVYNLPGIYIWPGVMVNEGEAITFSADYDMIIFNNGVDSQTADLYVPALIKEEQDKQEGVAQFTYNLTTYSTDGNSCGWWGINSDTFPSYTTDYARVYVNRPSNYTSNSITSLHYWKEGVDVEVVERGYIEISTDNWQVYFDVKIADLIGSKMQVKIYDSRSGYLNYTSNDSDYTYVSGDNAQVYYANDDKSLTRGIVNSPNPSSLGVILGGYFTCSDSLDNGYGNFDQLSRTWFTDDNGEFRIDDTWQNLVIDDFANGDTTYSGERDNRVTLINKYNMMMNLFQQKNDGSSALIVNNIDSFLDGSIIVIIAISLVAIGVISVLINRRKKVNN